MGGPLEFVCWMCARDFVPYYVYFVLRLELYTVIINADNSSSEEGEDAVNAESDAPSQTCMDPSIVPLLIRFSGKF